MSKCYKRIKLTQILLYFPDQSLLLTNKGCLLINVWNEAKCKGKQKMTASFVIVAHSVRLIYCNSDYFWTCCLHLDLYGWQKIHVLNAPSNRMLCKTLNFSSKIKKIEFGGHWDSRLCCRWVLQRNTHSCFLKIPSFQVFLSLKMTFWHTARYIKGNPEWNRIA